MSELDRLIDLIPIGLFHYRLLLMCGLAFMADAMEISLLSFVTTCAGDEWGLSNFQRASVTGAVFSGELIGGFFWGPVADKYGRKNAFLMASSLICSSGFLSGVAPNYKTLVVFRAIVGFGVGGLTVPFDLLAEFLPSGDRGKFLMYIEYFWTFGSIFVAGVAWAALDKIGWRGLSLVTAVPVTLSSIAAIIYLPESPRWLLIKGRFTEAEKVLKDAALINGVDLGTINLYPSEDLTEEASWGQFDVKKELDDTTFKDLINTPTMRRISLPLWFIWTAFGFTYYGIILLVGRIYTTDTDALVQTCSFQYRPIFINSSAELVGVFIAALIIDPWGRSKTQAAFYTVGGVAVLFMGFVSVEALPFISMIARIGAMGSSCATWVATSELYPTEMRATGHSVASALARIGAFIVPYFVISSISLTTVGTLLACVNFSAAIISMTLKETRGLKLDTKAPLKSLEVSTYPIDSPLHDIQVLSDQQNLNSESERHVNRDGHGDHILMTNNPLL